jgi:uncharacterized protein
MSQQEEAITALGEGESWQLLASRTLGRLVTCVAGRPEIFPLNFVTRRPSLLFRTAEGTRLLSALTNDRVAFEVDEQSVAEGWSVIVRGRAHVLSSSAEIERADRAQLPPWTPTIKRRYVRIIATEITGRSFRFGRSPSARTPSLSH